MSLRDEVAKCVRVKLAKQPSQPMTAESFGSVWNMQRAGNGAHHYEGSGGQSFIQAKGLVDSADAVRSSPHAVHFVAHLPEQLTPQEFNRYDGTRGVIIHAPGSPDGIEDLRTGASQNARAQAANQNVNEGQRRIRQLLGIQGDLPGRSPTVYFKSHRAAQLMAAATGGHVESVAIKPNAIARRVKVTQTPGYVERSPFMGIFDARSGAHSDQLTERMLPATDRHADQAPFVISQHPVIGEYMTLMGQRSVDPDNSWSVLDELNPHRGAVLQENGWQPNADVRHFYGDPPRHDHIAQLGQTAAQLHQHYLANPDDHLARAVLADHLEEIGQHELAGAFYASLPQQFSRRGDKLRLSAAVAERVRVQLARKAGQPMTADSLGGTAEMKAAGPGEYDDGLNVPFATLPPADEVRKSPHAMHFVAHHPMQALPISYHWSGTSYPIIDPQSANYGRYVAREDEAGHFDPVINGQRSVRSLLGLKSDEEHPPTVFFKSYKGARLAALLTGGHVESIAMRPQSTGEMIDRSNRYLRRGGGAVVTPRSADRFYDQHIYDNRDKSMPGLFERNRAVLGSWDDLMNGSPVGSNSNVEPLILDRHDVFGEYLTQPHGGITGGNPLWNRLSNHYGVPQSPHRSAILYHHGLIPVGGERREPTPESETAFHRLNREYPSAAHPLWHQGHSVPGQQMPITPEEAAEMAREHWATLLEHASAGRPLELAGMHVPTRQHIESLGPDAQHLWALQRDPVARLALGDMLEERGHDEMAHFMRATVPLQYARKKRDAASQPEPSATPPGDMAPITIDKSKKLAGTSGDPSYVVTHRSQVEPPMFGGVTYTPPGRPDPEFPLSDPFPPQVTLHANDWGNVAEYTNSGMTDAWDYSDERRWYADPPPHTVLLGDVPDLSPDARALDRQDKPHDYANMRFVFRPWNDDQRYENLRRAMQISKNVSDLLGIGHTRYSHVHFADRGAADEMARRIGPDAHVLEVPFHSGYVRMPDDHTPSEDSSADAPTENHLYHSSYGNYAVVRGSMPTRSTLTSNLAHLTEMASQLVHAEEDAQFDDDGRRYTAPGSRIERVADDVNYNAEEYREFMRGIWHHILSPHAQPHLFDIMFDLAPTQQLSAINSDPVARELLQHAIFDHRDPLKRVILADRLDEIGHAEAADWVRDLLTPEEQQRFRFSRRGKAERPGAGESPAILEPEIGFNVNDKSQAFTDQILNGEKTVETRSSPTLHPYVGQRMGLVRTGKGKAQLVGYVTIGKPTLYTTQESFDADAESHLVGADSPFHISKSKSGNKWGYPLLEVERLEPRSLVDGAGVSPNPRVARKLQRSSSLKSVVVQYASQKLRFAKGAWRPRFGDDVLVQDGEGFNSRGYYLRPSDRPGYHRIVVLSGAGEYQSPTEHFAYDISHPETGARMRLVGPRSSPASPNPYRDGDRVDVVGIGGGNYRRESLTQPGMHEVDIYERGRMTHRATVSLDRITRKPEPAASVEPPRPPAQYFSDPHDLQAGDVIRILNEDGTPIMHAREGGDDSHHAHGYELVNQDGANSPFVERHDPSVRVIPLGPRNTHRHPYIMGTRGRMFEVVRRGDGLPDRDRTYVDSYGNEFYIGDRVQVGLVPYTVLRNVVGTNPHVILRSDAGGETRYSGRQDASGAYTIIGLHARRLGDWQPSPASAQLAAPLVTAPSRPPARAANLPDQASAPLLDRFLGPHSYADGDGDKIRQKFQEIFKRPVDDETILHLLRVPRPFPGADPNHDAFAPSNLRLSANIGSNYVHAYVKSRLPGYSFHTNTSVDADKIYNSSQEHGGSSGVKILSTPHILQNQARAAHALGMPELKVTAGQMNPHRSGGMTGGLVWPMYGYTARLSDKYGTAHLDEAAQIIRRNDPSKQHVDSNDLWLHDLLSSKEGRAWYTEASPLNDATYYPHVISGSMRFRTHPDSESHKLLSAHTAKVEGHAARKSDPAPEA